MLVPFGIIYLFNWTVFVVIMVSVVNRTRKSAKLTVKEKSNVSHAKLLVLIALGLSIVFGLGWGIGIVTLVPNIADEDDVKFAIQFFFAILVGSQGLLIFLFHGVRSKEARKEWQSWLSKLPCLRHRRSWYSSSDSRSSRSNGTHRFSATETSTLKRSTLDKDSFGDGTIKGPSRDSAALTAVTSSTSFVNPAAILSLDESKAAEAEEEEKTAL